MVRINNINKKFGEKCILSDMSLTIEKKSIVGLAGVSGSGKSTLLRCIQKLDFVDSGTITCNGQTGFMFQDFQLFPHMTVLQNLIYAPKLHNKTIDHKAHAMKIISYLGIADKINTYPNQLSGGQKQRVALARSLMMSPQLLLYDEPTSGLDAITIHNVIILLKSIQNTGVTMIIASHDLDFLTKISDRVVILNNGKITLDVKIKNIEDPILYLKNYYLN